MLRSAEVWRKPVTGTLSRSYGFNNSIARYATAASTTPLRTANPASRPYARHRPVLPNPRSFKVPALFFILFSLSSWTAFTLHATNRERLASSVLKNVMEKIKDDERVQTQLGENVQLKREALLAGDPWINGSVNMMQGKVDMSFRVKGSRDSGKAYFTSIRRDQSKPYETLRFLIVLDSNKETISLLED
ncbi:hypothetical protein CBS101457_002180 [Exobasidium rhododendri]|nr:hypothetical protein CBS101457_002180 [Exobasidium rhododendri]